MVTTVKEWINLLISNNLLCKEYQDMFFKAFSKLSIMNICLDSNGISYLCEMEQKGFGLPYDVIIKDFGRYINGRYIAQFLKDGKKLYTSCMYCMDDKDTTILTTCTAILGCNKNIFINDYDFVRICLDRNSKVRIHCPLHASCIVELYGDASVENVYGFNNIMIKKI